MIMIMMIIITTTMKHLASLGAINTMPSMGGMKKYVPSVSTAGLLPFS